MRPMRQIRPISPIKNKLSLTIGWLYPSLMSTYGDRGNIICLTKRCEWRKIECRIVRIDDSTSPAELKSVDLFFGGGAQDREQEIVMRDLSKRKGKIMKEQINKGIPALFVCGSPQLMGNYYEPTYGKRIEGLGIFDMKSVAPGKSVARCIGNIVAEVDKTYLTYESHKSHRLIVGFENHGGRTYLEKSAKPFARVVRGYGNNGEDKTEGVVYKNAVGCYFHGPFLPKNPHVADWLIRKALEIKYKKTIALPKLDDDIEWKAHQFMLKRLKIT